MTKIKDWLFKTADGKYVIAQKPNWPVYAFAGLMLTSFLLNDELSRLVQFVAAFIAGYWATLELLNGVNNYRRVIGTIVVILSLLAMYNLIS